MAIDELENAGISQVAVQVELTFYTPPERVDVSDDAAAVPSFDSLKPSVKHQLAGIMVTVLLISFATQMLAPSKASALGLLPTE
jgi:hypothetical protein